MGVNDGAVGTFDYPSFVLSLPTILVRKRRGAQHSAKVSQVIQQRISLDSDMTYPDMPTALFFCTLPNGNSRHCCKL